MAGNGVFGVSGSDTNGERHSLDARHRHGGVKGIGKCAGIIGHVLECLDHAGFEVGARMIELQM